MMLDIIWKSIFSTKTERKVQILCFVEDIYVEIDMYILR